ncbi:hypothetical protein LC607_01495 [Nostoc sp. CHAB 5824]|nr:hypothetical protein [Nostoc sp. CHAB 5824]
MSKKIELLPSLLATVYLAPGVEFYKHVKENVITPEVMHLGFLSNSHFGEIELSDAFAINNTNVSKHLSVASWAKPNNHCINSLLTKNSIRL